MLRILKLVGGNPACLWHRSFTNPLPHYKRSNEIGRARCAGVRQSNSHNRIRHSLAQQARRALLRPSIYNSFDPRYQVSVAGGTEHLAFLALSGSLSAFEMLSAENTGG